MIRAAVLTIALAAVTVAAVTPEHLHATRGIVKSISRTALVVTRLKSRGDILFTLNDGTSIDGAIVIGALVSVRYYDQGAAHVATAVAAQPRPHGNAVIINAN
jgi:hypothetical protein